MSEPEPEFIHVDAEHCEFVGTLEGRNPNEKYDLTVGHEIGASNFKEENCTPLYGPDTILEIAPRGMNMTEIVCNSCGYSGMISKQLTDGYEPYCFRCGEQELTETREFSMLNMNRFKTIIRDKAGTNEDGGKAD